MTPREQAREDLILLCMMAKGVTREAAERIVLAMEAHLRVLDRGARDVLMT